MNAEHANSPNTGPGRERVLKFQSQPAERCALLRLGVLQHTHTHISLHTVHTSQKTSEGSTERHHPVAMCGILTHPGSGRRTIITQGEAC